MGLGGKKLGGKQVSQQQKEILWTQKQAKKEADWAAWHPTASTYKDMLDPSVKSALNGDTNSPYSYAGNPELIKALTQQYQSMSGDRQRQAGLAADLYGQGDPSLAAYGHLQASMGGAHDLYGQLSGALASSASQNQQYLGGVLNNVWGQNAGQYNQNADYLRQMALQRKAQKAQQAQNWGKYAMAGIGIGLAPFTGGASLGMTAGALGGGGGGGGGFDYSNMNFSNPFQSGGAGPAYGFLGSDYTNYR